MAEHDDDLEPADGPDYLWDRAGPPDPAIARLESLLSPLAHDDAPLELPAEVVPIARARRRRTWPIIAGAVAVAAAIVIVVVVTRHGGSGADGCAHGAGFAFSSDTQVRCDRGTGARGTLAVGGWIETDAGTARVEVASIGEVDLQPRSRLALRGTSDKEHRLALERGALHAKVRAPPRLFVVETPSATAIDLGCEYDLSVGADGTGLLTVTTGQVELAAPDGGIVVVPAATSATFSTRGIGLPIRTGATQQLRDAVTAFDPGNPRSVEAILTAAGEGDQITLLNLLVLAGPYDRDAIFDALHELSPVPDDVIKDAIIGGDPEALARWRESVVDGWMTSEWCLPAGPDKVDPHSLDEPPIDDSPIDPPPTKNRDNWKRHPVDAAPGDPPLPPMPDDKGATPDKTWAQ